MQERFVTPYRWRPQSQEEVIDGWHSGKSFHVYRTEGVLIHSDNTVQLKMMGITHIHFVWQLDDLRLCNYRMEL